MVSKVANMFLETAKKLAKELSPFDLPAINESKNGLIAYFPLYFSEFPLYIRKWWPLHKNALNLMKCFWWLLRYRDSHMHLNRNQ